MIVRRGGGGGGGIGPQGPPGPTGPQGLSAYQAWLAAGNSGTQADFLASLVGPQGPQGPPGTGGAGSGDTHGPVALGNVTATPVQVPMDATLHKQVLLTLTASHVSQITKVQGGRLTYMGVQDSVGGHTFSIQDGTTGQVLPIPIPTGPGDPFLIVIECPDGTNLWPHFPIPA